MIKQEKPPISPPPSPHWRRLQQPSRVVGRATGKPAPSISRVVDAAAINSNPRAAIPQPPSQPKPATVLPPKASMPEIAQPFWHHIPLLSPLIAMWLRMAKWAINTFVQDEPKPAPDNQNKDAYDRFLSNGWTWIKTILFWGTGAFIIILPLRWILEQIRLLQKGVVGKVSDTLDTKKPSAIPSWIKQILLIALGAILLPLYLRDRLIFGTLKLIWWGVKKAFFLGVQACLFFPLAVLLAVLLLGPDWLAPEGYPNPIDYSNVHQWFKAVERTDRLRIQSF